MFNRIGEMRDVTGRYYVMKRAEKIVIKLNFKRIRRMYKGVAKSETLEGGYTFIF